MYGLHEQLLAGLFRHLDEVGYRKVAQVHQNYCKNKSARKPFRTYLNCIHRHSQHICLSF